MSIQHVPWLKLDLRIDDDCDLTKKPRRITVPRQLPPSYLCTPCNAMQCLFVFASVLPRKSKFLLQNEALLRSFNPQAYEKAMNSAETGPAFQNRVLGSAGGCNVEMSDEELVCLHIYQRSCLGHAANWCKLMQIAKMPRIMQLLLLIWHVFCFWSISQCIHRITVKDGPQNWNFKNILKYWLVRFTKWVSEPQHRYQRVHSSYEMFLPGIAHLW